MSKMIEIEGRGQVLEETIIQALDEKFGKPKPYQFKEGDVAIKSDGYSEGPRIIVRYGDKLISFDTDGFYMSGSQKEFESKGYRKIGELKDYIKD